MLCGEANIVKEPVTESKQVEMQLTHEEKGSRSEQAVIRNGRNYSQKETRH